MLKFGKINGLPDWCRLPSGVKCSCLLTTSPEYERLSPTQQDDVTATADLLRRMTRVSPDDDAQSLMIYELDDATETKDSDNEKQQELSFHNDDGSYQLVTVERNLRATDLCQLLAVKNRAVKDPKWTLYEHWPDLGLERPLEDHEDVLKTYREMQCFSKRARKRFVFRKDPRKYEYFADPQNFFPSDMMVANALDDFVNPNYNKSFIQSSNQQGQPPKFTSVGLVWIRAGPACGNTSAQQRVWRQVLLLLAGSKLYYTREAETAARVVRERERERAECKENKDNNKEDEESSLELFADLEDYQVYYTLNARNHYRAPAEFGLCLRPLGDNISATAGPAPRRDATGTSPSRTVGFLSARLSGGGASYTMLKEEDARSDSTSASSAAAANNNSLRCVACDSERQRTGWLTAMRLAKYGKQLRENYRAFKNKGEAMQSKDYATYAIANDSLRSRVAMDFTGAQGRIVEDPVEALAVADAEGCSWRRRWRPTQRKQPPPFCDRDNRFIVTNSSNIIPNRTQQQYTSNSNSSSPSSQQLSPSSNHIHHHTSTPNPLYLNHTYSINPGSTPPHSVNIMNTNHHVSRRQTQYSKSPTNNGVLVQNYQQNMSHLSKQWFHPGVTREQAAAMLLNRQTPPTGDGIFLVRESRSSPTRGHFVLTYRHGGRACHAHVRPMLDQSQNDNVTTNSGKNDGRSSGNGAVKGRQPNQNGGSIVYSLDGGETKFYDLQQLIEFYQLNTTSGALPVKLTHYVSRDDATRHKSQEGSY